ncbi:DUF3379 domain-containing protein [Aliikangiella marina]|uniref:DUF3379 domain-containing protein n=1 Tax=Aliikangiella marina TaxID=1712262 RepID=A0A545T6I5_9GAMM|nr:DUF3379 domain-containing protein [Aliikangiella marina]TQV72798.1 DUF3379 domain-containing protein [Aliikangiella marina]
MKHQQISETDIIELARQNRFKDTIPESVRASEDSRQLYLEHKALFETITEQTQLAPEGDIWQRIELKREVAQHKRKNRRIMWGLSAIAASLLMVVGLQWNAMTEATNLQNQIQANILQSQHLEKVLLSNQSNVTVSFATQANISQELLEIDEALQKAYLNNESQQQILKLWESRVRILLESLTQEEEQSDLVTI